MVDFTTNEWAVVLLVLVAGYLLGLMSRSGSAKWRRQYEAERDAHHALRRVYDAHLQRHNEVRGSGVVDRDRDGIDDRDQRVRHAAVDRNHDGIDDRDQLPPVRTR